MITLTVQTKVELSCPETTFLTALHRSPGFWAMSIAYGAKCMDTGVQASEVRASLKAKGLVVTSRRPVVPAPESGRGATYESGELTDLGRAVVVALRERADAIEV